MLARHGGGLSAIISNATGGLKFCGISLLVVDHGPADEGRCILLAITSH
jgi:hypothetical protein